MHTPATPLKREVSRILQLVIPVLDAIYAIPFNDQRFQHSPGREYVRFMHRIEETLLLFWKRLQERNLSALCHEVLVWQACQKRSSESLLRHYYQFYEALGAWMQGSSQIAFSGLGTWNDYVFCMLVDKDGFLSQGINSNKPPQREELELIATRYLEHMQLISELDAYELCADFFTFIASFTQESYFIPQLTFSSPKSSSNPTHQELQTLRDRFAQSEHWSDCGSDYLSALKTH